MVPGEGPKPCHIAFVGEAPGVIEAKEGRPFVSWAPAGREFERYLRGVRLARDNVYVTNISKEPTQKNQDPTPEQLKQWVPVLEKELIEVDPRYIIPMGRFATRFFLGDVNMEMVHGLAYRNNGYVVIPSIHPAAGLHNPNAQAQIIYDFHCAADVIRGNDSLYWEPDDLLTYYSRTNHAPPDCDYIGMDTEGSKENPWCLSYSIGPGLGRVVLAKDVKPFKSSRVILHNSLHDLAVLRSMGVHLGANDFEDTMLMAYLLCLEPQGLKPLSYRIAGMDMQSYTDVIRPHKVGKELEYYIDMTRHEFEKPEGIPTIKRDGTLHVRQPQGVETLVKRAFTDLSKNPDLDLRARWARWSGDIRTQVEEKIGAFPEITLDDVPMDEAIDYAARDADATRRVFFALSDKINAMGLREVYEIDRGTIPMLDRMQEVGFLVDQGHFEKLGVYLEQAMDRLKKEICTCAGEEFNPASMDQVAEILFSKLKLTPIKLTKSRSRGSVDDQSLEALRDKHPLLSLLIDFREHHTIYKTYTNKLPKFIGEDGRIHPRIRTTRVPTGRLATSEPNLLAQPVRSALGRKIREGFIAGQGHVLGAWDLDQIELRVLAHESGDDNMISILSDPARHIHKETCARIYGMDVADVSKESTEYMMSKNISFGVAYGITSKGLHLQMLQRGQGDWTEQDCQKFIDNWYSVYPAVYTYQEMKKAETRRAGFVKDMYGRIRYLPGMRSDVPGIREEAIRQCINHPIQAGAQGVIKKAMILMWDMLPSLQEIGFIEPLLQVHDEVIFELDEDLFDLADIIIRDCMSQSEQLKVPITCSGNQGTTWAELK